MEKTAAATNLAIEKTSSANAAAIAACCCETKALILAESCATRELMNALNLKNIQDQLTDAKLKIALSERRPLIPGI